MPSITFDDATRRKLEQVMLHAGRIRGGALKGDRRSSKRGTSIEFADYRDYVPGDDLRRLDWNVLARLERPLTKLYEDEEDLAVHVLLDTSLSMDFPRADAAAEPIDPAAHKFTYGQRLAAGLGYISLHSGDRFTLAALRGTDAIRFGPARGRGYGVRLLTFVNDLQPGGATALSAALTAYAQSVKTAALVLLITDLFSADGWLDGAMALLGRGCEVVLIHTLAPAEIEPPLTGDLRLIDAETGTAQEVSIDAGLRTLYQQRVTAWRDATRADCTKRGIHYLPVVTGTAWEKIILTDLRKLGVVK